jgi:hypothetical protein
MATTTTKHETRAFWWRNDEALVSMCLVDQNIFPQYKRVPMFLRNSLFRTAATLGRLPGRRWRCFKTVEHKNLKEVRRKRDLPLKASKKFPRSWLEFVFRTTFPWKKDMDCEQSTELVLEASSFVVTAKRKILGSFRGARAIQIIFS